MTISKAWRTEAVSYEAHTSNYGGWELVRTSSFHLSSDRPQENASPGTPCPQQGPSESAAAAHGGEQWVPGEPEKAGGRTCSGPRQPAVGATAFVPPSAQSGTARCSRACAAAEAEQQGNGCLLRQKVRWSISWPMSEQILTPQDYKLP